MGKTLQTWVETGVLITVFVVILSVVIILPMNVKFGQNHSIGITGNLSEYESLQKNLGEKFEEGKPTFLGSLGIALSSSWDVVRLVAVTIWNLISGNWIMSVVVDMLKMPEILGRGIQIMYFMSIIFIIWAIIFRRSGT